MIRMVMTMLIKAVDDNDDSDYTTNNNKSANNNYNGDGDSADNDDNNDYSNYNSKQAQSLPPPPPLYPPPLGVPFLPKKFFSIFTSASCCYDGEEGRGSSLHVLEGVGVKVSVRAWRRRRDTRLLGRA